MNNSSKHYCSTCETCLCCHKCLQYKASTFRGNSSESEEEFMELFESSADTHFKDVDPQYIRVGPDNEKITTTPDGTTLSITTFDDNSSSDEQQAVIDLPSWIDEDSDIADPPWSQDTSVIENRLKSKIKPVSKDDSDEYDPPWNEDTSVTKDRPKIKNRTVIDDESDEDDPSWKEDSAAPKDRRKFKNRTLVGGSSFLASSWVNVSKGFSRIKSQSTIKKRPLVKKRPRRQRASWITKLQRIQAGLDVEESLKNSESSDAESNEDDPQSLNCQICDKAFTSKKDLKIHQIYHSTEEVHECKLCGMQFEYSYELIKHSINHRNPNNICEYCKREFKTAEKLRVHIASHTGDYPYFCVVCNKGFKDYTRLKSHLLCHTDDKPFMCENCGKCFRRKSQLKTHSWVHSEVKPYACDVCDKPFNYKCNLQLHMQRCHYVFDD